MKKLAGKRIALAGSRKIEEISKIVENLGGMPLVRPAQGTVFLDDSNVEKEIIQLLEGHFDWIILTTSVGAEILYKTAGKLGKEEEFMSMLQNLKIAARGYKTINWLKKLGLTPLVRDDDGSTAGLVRNLKQYSLKNCKVALQLHGDPAPKLIKFLEEQNAQYKEVLPYIHIPPKDEIIGRLLGELLNREIDTVLFTSTPQVRYLMQYAREKGVEKKLIEIFSNNVIALAVGKVTAQALREEGIARVIFPENERMGSAIVTLAQFYEQEVNNE